MNLRRSGWLLMGAALFPVMMGANECQSGQPAPDMEGQWGVTYDDTLQVEIGIGGAVYNETISAAGGTITIMHDGKPITFDLDCAKPGVVCPSEIWPAEVGLTQPNANYLRRVWVQIPDQECDGTLVTPAASECGAGTLNPDCEQVCDGTVHDVTRNRFGLLNSEGTRYDVLLGAGIATNGLNCALLGVSSAHADVITTGSDAMGNWRGEGLTNGEIVVGYAGGCLWAGDPDDDGTLEALVVGASIKFTTGFEANRLD